MAFSLTDCERYPNSFGIVGIGQLKTRRPVVHAPRQYVLLECAAIANFVRRVLETVPTSARSQPLWTLLPERHFTLFGRVLGRLGIQNLGSNPPINVTRAQQFYGHVPATSPHFDDEDGGPTRKRSNVTLLEGAYFLRTTCVPADTEARLDSLVELAPVLLASAPLPPPTPTPTFLQWD